VNIHPRREEIVTGILFSAFPLRNVTVPNRIVVSPMCQYSAVDGVAGDWHLIHLGQFALSGAGLVFVEATAVEAIGRITPGCLGLYSDQAEQALAAVVRSFRAHAGKSRIGIQLAHAGRKASISRPWEGGRPLAPKEGGWRTVGPSAIPFDQNRPAPEPLDEAGIARIKAAFVQAAQRAVAIGFDVIELHMAHGYLLSEFMSPLANRRTDAYGGTLANRVRLPAEIFAAVRAAVPAAIPVGARISGSDWAEGGAGPDDAVALGRALKDQACDFLDVSSGGVVSTQQMTVRPGYQLPFADRVKREVGLPTMAVGLITRPQQAEAIVAAGHADFVSLGRAMLDDPRWPWHAAAALGAAVEMPAQYGYAVGPRWREVTEQGGAAPEPMLAAAQAAREPPPPATGR
jgi:2,4-dienoyl-CoA reductase-like NADH-dependent reductase (Old Yellow Enzyme family)